MEKIRILLADDHQLFLDGLSALLGQIASVEIVAAVSDGAQLLEKLKGSEGDLVIVDLHMPVLGGLETTKMIRELYPAVKVLGLTMDNEVDSIQDMLEAGASGYILKNTGKAELETAILQVMKGEVYLSQSLSNQLAQRLLLKKKAVVEEACELDMLTEREVEILKMVALENSNTEIAEKLYISPKTVETHRKNLMKKIGARNSLGIYKFAVKHQLIN
ncbi:MAG: response regulator transcription factor [Prolixibacteraceae bacterium]|nr:response regulator transcription factor [Prolixibacteraceae bacterium]